MDDLETLTEEQKLSRMAQAIQAAKEDFGKLSGLPYLLNRHSAIAFSLGQLDLAVDALTRLGIPKRVLKEQVRRIADSVPELPAEVRKRKDRYAADWRDRERLKKMAAKAPRTVQVERTEAAATPMAPQACKPPRGVSR